MTPLENIVSENVVLVQNGGPKMQNMEVQKGGMGAYNDDNVGGISGEVGGNFFQEHSLFDENDAQNVVEIEVRKETLTETNVLETEVKKGPLTETEHENVNKDVSKKKKKEIVVSRDSCCKSRGEKCSGDEPITNRISWQRNQSEGENSIPKDKTMAESERRSKKKMSERRKWWVWKMLMFGILRLF